MGSCCSWIPEFLFTVTGLSRKQVDHEKLIEVCESEATLMEYMFGTVMVGKYEDPVKKKRILADSTVKSTRDQLKWKFSALFEECRKRDGYRSPECHLEILPRETDTEEPASTEGDEHRSGAKRPKKKRRKTSGTDNDVLRWDRTFTPGPILSFLCDGTRGV